MIKLNSLKYEITGDTYGVASVAVYPMYESKPFSTYLTGNLTEFEENLNALDAKIVAYLKEESTDLDNKLGFDWDAVNKWYGREVKYVEIKEEE